MRLLLFQSFMNNAVTASKLQEDNVMARKFLTMDGNEAAAHAARKPVQLVLSTAPSQPVL